MSVNATAPKAPAKLTTVDSANERIWQCFKYSLTEENENKLMKLVNQGKVFFQQHDKTKGFVLVIDGLVNFRLVVKRATNKTTTKDHQDKKTNTKTHTAMINGGLKVCVKASASVIEFLSKIGDGMQSAANTVISSNYSFDYFIEHFIKIAELWVKPVAPKKPAPKKPESAKPPVALGTNPFVPRADPKRTLTPTQSVSPTNPFASATDPKRSLPTTQSKVNAVDQSKKMESASQPDSVPPKTFHNATYPMREEWMNPTVKTKQPTKTEEFQKTNSIHPNAVVASIVENQASTLQFDWSQC